MVKEIMKEVALEIDDVRWYLSVLKTRELLELKSDPYKIAEYLRSKQLEADLYEMEERYLSDLEDAYTSGRIDEVAVREAIYAVNKMKTRRALHQF